MREDGMTEPLMEQREMMNDLASLVIGHKATLTNGGISEDAAEMMAAQYHAVLLHAITSQGGDDEG